jgi:hypothetical protein
MTIVVQTLSLLLLSAMNQWRSPIPILIPIPIPMLMDRAPLVETRDTRRRSLPATPVRELPLRLPVIA